MGSGNFVWVRRLIFLILIFLALIVIAIAGWFLRRPSQDNLTAPALIPVSLQSKLEPDYSSASDTIYIGVAGVVLDLIWDAIADRDPNADVEARKQALLTQLLTPVPTVTPAACQGEHVVFVEQDTWLNPAEPATIYGSDQTLALTPGSIAGRILLDAAVESAVPAGAFINRARLVLTLNPPGQRPEAPTLSVFALAEPFSETTSHWGNPPQLARHYISRGTTGEGVHIFDVTNLVRDWLSGSVANYGLALELPNPATGSFSYFSREASPRYSPKPAVTTRKSSPRICSSIAGVCQPHQMPLPQHPLPPILRAWTQIQGEIFPQPPRRIPINFHPLRH